MAPISAVSSGSQPGKPTVRSRPPIWSASYTTGLRPIFISSYAATMPERPPPMTATSAPCSVAGIWPSPAGCARKSSYA